MLPRLLPLLFWWALAWTAQAELAWDQPLQEFHRAPEDLELKTHFAFKNSGQKPVEITGVVTSCGCTAARLEKKTFSPGEQGTIDVQFTFGGRRGEQRKTITVSTSDGRRVLLELRCTIEDALELKPALVFWRIGDPADEKTVTLTVNNQARISVTEVVSDNPSLLAQLETIEQGRRYLIRIRPASTAKKETGQLRVKTNFPPDAPKSYAVFARIK